MVNRARKWWLAGLLSLLEPGLGQLYNGQGRKGIILLVFPLIFWPLFYLLCSLGEYLPWILGFSSVMVFFYYAAAVIDAIWTAKRYGWDYRPKKYNKDLYYIGIVVLVAIVNVAISDLMKNNFMQAYKISAASNEPTLLVGDHILVDRRPIAREPGRGDLVVFEFLSEPPKDFVKRVVGLPGDRLELRDKALFINGLEVQEPYAFFENNEVLSRELGSRDNFGPVTVPVDGYFVMGDNRDQSYDSRYWGFVKKNRIKGIVKSVYWSWDGSRKVVRWNRIGLRVN